MELRRFETPGISHYAYLLVDGGEAAIIDPRRDVEEYLDAARSMGVRLRYIIETHRHEDFVMGSAHLRELTGAQVVNGKHDCFGRGDLRLDDGDEVQLGDLKIVGLHTPGHTPESMCWAVYTGDGDQAWGVFTGDTLFFGDTGRSDLPDEARSVENAARIYDSVHEKLLPLGDGTLVFPAHGPGSVCGSGMAERASSTIGLEREYNDVFQLDRDAFAEKKGGERLPRPPYFRHMEKVNLGGGLPPASGASAATPLDPAAFRERASGGMIIDTREPEGFAASHIPDARSVWMGGLPIFGGWVASEDDDIYLCTDGDDDVSTACEHLNRIGIDAIRGWVAGGFPSWRSSGERMRRAGVITPRELKESSGLQVLDVREPDEFASGHIPGAINVYVGHLEEKLEELSFDRKAPVVVTCGVGHRAGVGVSILLRAGFEDVRNLLGGMKRWHALDYETRDGDAP